MSTWVQNVRDKWVADGVKVSAGASLTDIKLAEITLDFKFPPDFIDFYLAIDGFEGLDWQEHMFTLWPLKMIIEEYQDSSDKDFVSFCDYLIDSHRIGFRKSVRGIHKDYNIKQNDLEPIAQSFEEFIELINTDTGDIY